MDQEKANKLKRIARRTINIIDSLLRGEHPRDIAFRIKCDRPLVEYYKRILTK